VIGVLAAAHPGDASGFLVRDGQLSGKSIAGVLIRGVDSDTWTRGNEIY
jgi:hypothetical protein